MSSGTKVVHQDYIVKQRYLNTLPPPPGAPKLLKIPFNPMATYLSPFYLERMRQAEPINIEADAFLGMPIDLVGMPGVFEGDDKVISAPLNPPPIHPRDKLLLRPLKALGKGGSEPSDISFLRRTQYVANEDRAGRGTIAASGYSQTSLKRRRIDVSKEDENHILRTTMKGFDIANADSAPTAENGIRALQPTREELDAWNKPKHPSKPHLRVLDSYPLLPDMKSVTNAPDGGFSVITFKSIPNTAKDQHDERVDTGVLRSVMDELVIQDYNARLRAHNSNPLIIPRPPAPAINFELFLPSTVESSQSLKRKRNINNPHRDEADELQASEGVSNTSKLNLSRNYESGLQTENQDKYQEIGLALHDSSVEAASPAAYYYPITGKVYVKPSRNLPGATASEDSTVHELEITFRDPDAEEVERREGIRAQCEGRLVNGNVNDDAGVGVNGNPSTGNGTMNVDDDAEGEEEE